MEPVYLEGKQGNHVGDKNLRYFLRVSSANGTYSSARRKDKLKPSPKIR